MKKNIFERVEKKYLATPDQCRSFLSLTDGRLRPDRYAAYTICNLYYDTDRYDLIRTSLDKPLYKEKLRMRSYGRAEADSPVYLELKKKLLGVVYKRRAVLPYAQARAVAAGADVQGTDPETVQTLREIACFLSRYPVEEKAYISYDRTAYAGVEDPQLRVTFDRNIRFRQRQLGLESGMWGAPVLPPGRILMEIKVAAAFPVWLSHALSELALYPVSFSKYGACYQNYILKTNQKERSVATSA